MRTALYDIREHQDGARRATEWLLDAPAMRITITKAKGLPWAWLIEAEDEAGTRYSGFAYEDGPTAGQVKIAVEAIDADPFATI